jgi:hypothetical protein
LVLDNAPAPDSPSGLRAPLARLVDLLPQVVHGQVLVTSRDARWEQHAALAELEVFTSEEAVAFLMARSGASDEQAADQVAALLGGLPLALEQTGAYVRETRIALSAYLDRLHQFPAMTLAKGRPRDRNPTDTVATTWQVSLEQVRSIPGAVALLEMWRSWVRRRSLGSCSLSHSTPTPGAGGARQRPVHPRRGRGCGAPVGAGQGHRTHAGDAPAGSAGHPPPA